MNETFLNSLKGKQLNDFQKQLILFVSSEKYQSLYDNLAKHAKITNSNQQWEETFFKIILQTQLDVVNGKINPQYVLSYVLQKVTAAMNDKNDNISLHLQDVEFTN